jgi:thiamine pyrophosphokinase
MPVNENKSSVLSADMRSAGLFGLIVASGNITDYGLHRIMLAQIPAPDMTYCADGGLRHAKAIGIVPDLIIGDFDSVVAALLSEYRGLGVPTERLPAEKDYTDTEMAVARAVRDGCRAILILGALGARIDHTYANLQLIYKYTLRGIRVALADAHGVTTALVPGRAMNVDKQYPIASMLGLDYTKLSDLSDLSDLSELSDFSGKTIFPNPKLSIFPVGGAARGVNACGVKYKLAQASLESCYTSGVSNEFTSRSATVEVSEGAIYVMVCAD